MSLEAGVGATELVECLNDQWDVLADHGGVLDELLPASSADGEGRLMPLWLCYPKPQKDRL